MHDSGQFSLAFADTTVRLDGVAAEVDVVSRLLNLAAYRAAISDALSAYLADRSSRNALALTVAAINACFEHSAPGVAICVNCSWGKDSSAMLGVIASVMLERKTKGLRVGPVIIAIAHTGNEFVAMEKRIEEQNERVAKWGKAHGFDISILVARPKIKDSLIALMAGAGYALPSYSHSTRATVANWCVDRLKRAPIEKSLRMAKGKASRFLQFLGVRSDESATRANTIDRYSEGLPQGLSRFAKGDDGGVFDPDRLAVQPLAHWTDEDLRLYLRDSMADWDPFSFESLKAIYRLGADDKDLEGVSECSIVRTKDGGVSNVCSDLGGARFGCMLCIRTKNASLMNMARRERRYVWINAAHKFIYSGIQQHKRRMRDISAHGFENATMFCRGYTFQWRYTLLMFLYRAEIESGFTLVDPETEGAIKAHWERSGIITVSPADARRDALAWKATGKLRRSYEAAQFNYDSLAVGLPDGLPLGVYAHLRNTEHFTAHSALTIANLLALAGKGGSFFPQLKAHVFKDHSARGGYVTILSDVPSDMGKRQRTDDESGFDGTALEFLRTRELTSWERRLLRGRITVYRHKDGELESRFSQLSGRTFAPGNRPPGVAGDLHDILMANLDANSCDEKTWVDASDERSFIATLAGRMSEDRFRELHTLVGGLTECSELLGDVHTGNARRFQRLHREYLQLHQDGTPHDEAAANERATRCIKEAFDLRAALPLVEQYIDGLRHLKSFVDAGEANTELVNRLAYIDRMSWHDEGYAQEMLLALKQSLKFAERTIPRAA